MGFDEFLEDNENTESSTDNEQEEVEDVEYGDPLTMDMARRAGYKIFNQAESLDMDVEIDDDEITISRRDIGMVFWLVCLDYPDADPYDLMEEE